MNIIDFILTTLLGLLGATFLIVAVWLVIKYKNGENKK